MLDVKVNWEEIPAFKAWVKAARERLRVSSPYYTDAARIRAKIREIYEEHAIDDYGNERTFTTCAVRTCANHIVILPSPDGPLTGCENCEKCNAHCHCWTCGACDTRYRDNSSCSWCDYCSDCCECSRCESCGEACERTCGDCDRCEGCCSCNEETPRAVELFSCGLHFHKARAHERKINPSPRFISAEIEVSSGGNYSVETAVRKWSGSIVEDGSLPEEGFEINTAPAGGDKYVEQITDICAALRNSSGEANEDCGLHVHIDARDYDYYAVRRLVRIYARIEDSLFGMCAPSRRESTYCMPCGEYYANAIAEGTRNLMHKDLRKRAFETIYNVPLFKKGDKKELQRRNRDIVRRKNDKYDGARYKALNLHSWFLRGTIECRMFNGTVNRDKIINWGMLWSCLLDYCLSATDKDIDAALAKHTDGKSMLHHIASTSAAHERLSKFIDDRTAKFSGRASRED